METHELTITRTISASREAVFAALIEKAELEKWFCPEGMTVTMDELDVIEGGKFSLTMKGNESGLDHSATGTYKEVSAPERLAFSWQWIVPDIGAETLISIDLKEVDGKTDLTFTHSDFATSEHRDKHNEGWNSAFKRFDQLFV